MKKNQVFLFFLRMFFYFSVLFLILQHPGISISFDRIGTIQWFVIIPLSAVIAFLPEGKPFFNNFRLTIRSRFLFAALLIIVISFTTGGFNFSALPLFFAGFLSFSLTFLLFNYPRWAKAAVLEPFFLAWVCLRLLALSRSGEEIAGQSMALTQFILVWTAVVFLFHSVVVYLCLYPKSIKGVSKEGLLFFISAAAALLIVIAVLPPDFIRNTVIENLLPQRVPERMGEDSERGIPRSSEGRNEGRRTLPQSGNERQPGLRGVSERNWQNRTGRSGRNNDGSADNRQYLVMVVASDREPVYMGNSFRGHLDPVEGFVVDTDEPINRLANQRFFTTWFSFESEFDLGRRRHEVFSLSTLPQKYLPWRPLSIDPVILSEDTGPLRYIHQVVSNTNVDDPLRLINIPSRPFNIFEENDLAQYFLIPLDRSDIEIFNNFLNNAVNNWNDNREDIIRNNRYFWEIFSERAENPEPVNEHIEKLAAILMSFTEYQYNLSYNDSHTIETLKEFLLFTKEGDCVEFSNTFAILGRLAGLPSRVVTGFLAAEGLQTTAHLRGLSSLREQIPVLQQFPFNDLYMVTNLHSHSWTQFYIPDYGWLDFEATSFAIPPLGNGDFNTWDVVIPLIDEERIFSNIRKFPWYAVLRSAGMLAVFALVLAYVLRYGRELVLFLGARSGSRNGARSLYLLLLARLAADGQPIKPASKTAHEYSELFSKTNENQHFKTFADIYSEIRWRKFDDSAVIEERFEKLRQEYQNILNSTRRRGFLKWLIRLISLRGLAYL